VSLLPPGAWPYLAPYGAFLALAALQDALPTLAPGLFVLRVAVPLALLFAFWRRGAYSELRGYSPNGWVLADVAFGLVIAAGWLAPYLAWPSLARGEPFDPALLGAGREALTLGVRLLGFAIATPFAEELFVRSFVLRFAEVASDGRDFRTLPVARFAFRGFLVSALWFGFSHAGWEWWVAFPTGVAFNAWLYWRGHLGACVVAHAAANAAIWGVVVGSGDSLWPFL
jgi:CAAX prenyl protease-like protein